MHLRRRQRYTPFFSFVHKLTALATHVACPGNLAAQKPPLDIIKIETTTPESTADNFTSIPTILNPVTLVMLAVTLKVCLPGRNI